MRASDLEQEGDGAERKAIQRLARPGPAEQTDAGEANAMLSMHRALILTQYGEFNVVQAPTQTDKPFGSHTERFKEVQLTSPTCVRWVA